jgi:hypothetical protein
MEDPTTIALNLTFFGTLGVAFVMFIGLFLVIVATLVLAGIGRLVAVIVMALFGRRAAVTRGASAGKARPERDTKKRLKLTAIKPTVRTAVKHPPLAVNRHDPAAMSEDWAAAVARADARATDRAKAEAAPEIKVSVRDLPGPDVPVNEVTAVAPLVESAMDRNALVRDAVISPMPRSFEKPPATGPLAMLDTGSLVSLSGHAGILKGQLPVERRRAG